MPSHIVSKHAFVRNLASNWATVVVAIVVGLLLTPFIVAKLGIAIYGAWSLANSLLGYLGLIDLGVRPSIGRFVNHYLARGDIRRLNEVMSTGVAFLTGASILVLLAALWLGQNFALVFPKTPASVAGQMLPIMLILAVSVWLAFMGAIYASVLAAHDRFEIISLVGIAAQLFRAAGVVAVLVSGWGLLGLAVINALSTLAGVVASVVVVRWLYKDIAVLPRYISWDRFIELWRFGPAAFLTRASHQLIYKADHALVMWLFGAKAVGIYSIATMLIEYGQRFVDQIGHTLYPSVIRAGSLADMDSLRRLFSSYAKTAYFLSIMLFVGFIVFGERFITLWIGSEAAGAATVLVLLSGAELAVLLVSTGGVTLFALGRLKFNVWSSIGEAFANVVLSLSLAILTDLGIAAVALGSLLAGAAVRGFIHPAYVCRLLGLSFHRYLADIGLRALAAGLAAYSIYHLVILSIQADGWPGFLLQVAIAAAAYLITAQFLLLPRAIIADIWDRVARWPVRLTIRSRES